MSLYTSVQHRYWPIASFMTGDPPAVQAEISETLLKACLGKKNPIILEIGANIGQTSRWFLDVFPECQLYCFEPDPRAARQFSENVGERANVHFFNIALSDRTGTAEFFQSSGSGNQGEIATPCDWNQSGSLKKPTGHLELHPWVGFERTLEVETETLDNWAKKHGIVAVDFIWMDVQGAEIEVFRGGVGTLSRTRCLYTEYSNRELYAGQGNLSDIRRELRTFQVLVRYPGDVLLWNANVAKIPWMAYWKAWLTYLRF
jgi:FkbM family methyltransferase